MRKRAEGQSGNVVKGTARAGHHECLVCGTTVLVTESLFPGGDARWDCPACFTSGSLATFRPSPGQAGQDVAVKE